MLATYKEYYQFFSFQKWYPKCVYLR